MAGTAGAAGAAGANPAAESRTFSIYQRRSMIHDLVVQVFRGSLPRATYSPRSC